MAVRVGINGFGRIGRLVFRAMAQRAGEFEVVAINDLSDAAALKQLLKYEPVHGRFPGTMESADKALIFNGKRIDILSERVPRILPCGKLCVDVVLESTG